MYTNTNKTQWPKFHGRSLSFLRRHTLVVSILFQSLKKDVFGLQPSKPVVLKWEWLPVWPCLETCWLVMTRIWWVDARDAGRQPLRHRAAPTTKNHVVWMSVTPRLRNPALIWFPEGWRLNNLKSSDGDGGRRLASQIQGKAEVCVGLGSWGRRRGGCLKCAGGVWQLRPSWCEFRWRCGEQSQG